MTPRISAIIPTFNRARMLEDCIRSALDQSVACHEVLVIDHGSTDETLTIVEGFGAPVRCVQLTEDPHGRPARSRNAGLRVATGDIVCFLDDDDEWLPDKNRIQLENLEASGAALVCSDAVVVDDSRDVVRPSYLEGFAPSGGSFDELLHHNFVIASSVMAWREELVALGGFNQHPSLRGSEDYELWLRVAAKSVTAYVTEPLVRYRLHTSKLSNELVADSFRLRRAAMLHAAMSPSASGRRPAIAVALAREYARQVLSTARRLG